MEVGEVRVAEDKDFELLKIYLTRNDGWRMEYDKPKLSVWTRSSDDNNDRQKHFKMIRLKATLTDVPASVAYDVIQDSMYKKTWDKHTMEIREIGHINLNNNICYFSMSCPPPLKNRDFVVQSSWLETSKEYMIINHSVFHKDFPPKKGFIRATSYLTGYLVKPLSNGGCEVGYVTHSDPGGKTPSWVTNKISTILAPQIVKKLHKACLNYNSWKQKNNPSCKIWLYPEQITSPKVNIALDCVKPVSEPYEETESPDESMTLEDLNITDSDDESNYEFT